MANNNPFDIKPVSGGQGLSAPVASPMKPMDFGRSPSLGINTQPKGGVGDTDIPTQPPPPPNVYQNPAQFSSAGSAQRPRISPQAIAQAAGGAPAPAAAGNANAIPGATQMTRPTGTPMPVAAPGLIRGQIGR